MCDAISVTRVSSASGSLSSDVEHLHDRIFFVVHTFDLELAENAFFASERLMLIVKDWYYQFCRNNVMM